MDTRQDDAADAQHAEGTRFSRYLHGQADEMEHAAEALEDKAEETRQVAQEMEEDAVNIRDRAEELHEQANQFDSEWEPE